MRGLLIGASGQLGRALSAVFSRGFEMVEAGYRHARAGQLRVDLGDAGSVLAALREAKPDVILIAGAMCNVDLCELEPMACRRVNALGPQVIAEYAREKGNCVVLFSTDHVFDGSLEAYEEWDRIGPLNAYARSKAMGEAIVRELMPDGHLVIRTSWLYGPDEQRRNFVLRVVDRLAAGESVLVPSDQWGSPTYSEDLARATRFLVEHGHRGTFHATGPEFIDRASFARRICGHFGLDEGSIVPKLTSELGQAAPRPLRVRLNCRKLRAAGAQGFKGIDSGLACLSTWDASFQRV